MEHLRGERETVLVLGDQFGGYYAVPQDIVESYRVTDQQRQEIESLLESDVAGLSFVAAAAAQPNATDARLQAASAARLAHRNTLALEDPLPGLHGAPHGARLHVVIEAYVNLLSRHHGAGGLGAGWGR